MSQTVQIASTAQFNALLKTSKVVVADFYADWCGPCKAIAPAYEKRSSDLSRKNLITFTKVNTESQQELAAQYNITSLPTFIVFKDGKQAEKITGADPFKLQEVLKDLEGIAKDGGAGGASSSGSSSGPSWASVPEKRQYAVDDVTDQIDLKGLELLNADPEFGTVRTLVDEKKPSALDSKGNASDAKDWIESDTDEQLMLYIPFQATLKIDTIQITSIPPPIEDEDDDEHPMRPKTIKLYTNKPHTLGFDEADDIQPTQTVELKKEDWDSNGSVNIGLRYVNFQNVSSLVMFVVDGDREGGERTRIDRIRILGQTGEKRELGKLEKVGDEQGE